MAWRCGRLERIPKGPFALCVYGDDVDDAAERLRAAGATEVLAPTGQPWGERMCSFVDADGHLVHVGTKR